MRPFILRTIQTFVRIGALKRRRAITIIIRDVNDFVKPLGEEGALVERTYNKNSMHRFIRTYQNKLYVRITAPIKTNVLLFDFCILTLCVLGIIRKTHNVSYIRLHVSNERSIFDSYIRHTKIVHGSYIRPKMQKTYNANIE